jgi:CRISP-associated protein Cas1
MLNYAYGVLQGQFPSSLIATGFDPACGILHIDKVGRASLVFDAMEPLRPVVDGLVLGFLAGTTFRPGDMQQGTDGVCRLHPQLARTLVERCRVPDAAVQATIRDIRAGLAG